MIVKGKSLLGCPRSTPGFADKLQIAVGKFLETLHAHTQKLGEQAKRLGELAKNLFGGVFGHH